MIAEFLVLSLRRTRHLTLTLRLQLADFAEMEHHFIHPTSDWIPNPTSWLRLCPAIAQLQHLRSLHIRADHDSSESYTFINERGFLSPLTTLLALMPTLDIHINLPKILPKFESAERHCTHRTPAPPFPITRRYRRRRHAVTNRKGERTIKGFSDTPMLDPPDQTFDSGADSDVVDALEEEAEGFERRLWERGDDVKRYVREYWEIT